MEIFDRNQFFFNFGGLTLTDIWPIPLKVGIITDIRNYYRYQKPYLIFYIIYRIFEAKKQDFPGNGNISYGLDCPSAKFLLQKLEMISNIRNYF